jgi:hypothetical protein
VRGNDASTISAPGSRATSACESPFLAGSSGSALGPHPPPPGEAEQARDHEQAGVRLGDNRNRDAAGALVLKPAKVVQVLDRGGVGERDVIEEVEVGRA